MERVNDAWEAEGRPRIRIRIELNCANVLVGNVTVWGRLMPAAASLKAGALPIGLAHRVKLKRDIAHGAVVRWSDVEIDAGDDTIKTRRAMEARFRGTADRNIRGDATSLTDAI
jgi:predicted homoserine dehydrogenase-like protein